MLHQHAYSQPVLEEGGPATRREARASAVAARPRWWAVLAVSLALMALVASLTSGSSGAPGTAGAGAALFHHRSDRSPGAAADRRSADGTGRTVLPPAGSSDTEAGVPGSDGPRPVTTGADDTMTATTTRSTAPPSSHASTAAQPGVTSPATTPSSDTTPATASTATATPTATTAPTTATTTTTAAASEVSTRFEIGNLTYPDNVTALYSFPGTGPLEATATWSGASDLTLSVTCAGRTATRTGASGLSVSVAEGSTGSTGTCTVSITEPTGVRSEVSYSLDVRDGPGGGS